jgi:hypothetical protein
MSPIRRESNGWEHDQRISASWRRERDSNPRYGFPYSGFQDRLFQPLTHPSATIGRLRSGWPSCGQIARFLSTTSVARAATGREQSRGRDRLFKQGGVRSRMKSRAGADCCDWNRCAFRNERTRRTAPSFSADPRANGRVRWRVPWLRRGHSRVIIPRRLRGVVGVRFLFA